MSICYPGSARNKGSSVRHAAAVAWLYVNAYEDWVYEDMD